MALCNDALVDAIERQYDLYEPYRILCELQSVERADLRAFVDAGEAWRVPTVPADWFKRAAGNGLYERLSMPDDEGAWLLSSSTSGDHSYVWRTPADQAVIAESFGRFWRSLPVETALFFAPPVAFLQGTGARAAVDHRTTWPFATVPLGHAEESCYPDLHWLLQPRQVDGAPAMELQRELLIEKLEQAEAEGRRIGLCMSVLALYPAVCSLPRSYDLGRNALVQTGAGGWDGRKGTNVGDPLGKPTFVRDVAERLGIPEDAWGTNFVDSYGASEVGKNQTGWYSEAHGDHVYETTDDVLVYLIDPVTEEPAGAGGRGYVRVMSPYGCEGAAAVSVQLRDLVTAVETNADGSVRSFTHITRSSGTDGEGGVGCALSMIEEVSA